MEETGAIQRKSQERGNMGIEEGQHGGNGRILGEREVQRGERGKIEERGKG